MPDKRLAELRARALAAGIHPVPDPGDLARTGIRTHLETLGQLVPPERPEVSIRLHGAGVPGHEMPVRGAAAILLSLQETVSSIGQALRYDPTLQGAIQGQIIAATKLSITSDVGLGSVVFRLLGPGEAITGSEARELTGTDTLVDAAMAKLFALVEQSAAQGPDSSELAQELRRLGPRTAKHLSDLAKRVLADEIDVDLSWRSPAGRRRQASLQRSAAHALTRAIELNKVETQVIELPGILDTISTAHKLELRTDEGRVHLAVSRDLAPTLGPFYNQPVVATVERTITWSTNTGKEKRTFMLLSVRLTQAFPERKADHGLSDVPVPETPSSN